MAGGAPGIIPPRWQEYAAMPKRLIGWPQWSQPASLEGSKRQLLNRDELHTAAAEITEVVVPLADEKEIGIEGVQLRMNAWAFKRQHEVTATLEVPGGRRSSVSIIRVDAWPSSPHLNTRARKVPALRHIPPVVEGSHVHRFRDNSLLGASAFLPPSNLPVAVPLLEPLTSFRGFLRTVSEEFNIEGLEDFDPPPWQEYML